MTGGPDGLGREIVLALLVEEPGSAYELEKRLRERFASSDWARGIALKSLRRLQVDGLAKPVEGSPPRGRSRVEWEATPEGVEHAKNWVGECITRPLIREELYARVVLSEVLLSGSASLLRLLDVARAAERACELELGRLEEAEDDDDEDGGLLEPSSAAYVERAWQRSLISYYRTVRRHLEKRVEQAPPSGGAVN